MFNKNTSVDRTRPAENTETGFSPGNITRFGIAGKIILFLAIFSIMTTLLVSSWIFTRFDQQLVTQEFSELSAQSLLHASRFRSQIDEMNKDVKFLAGTPPVNGIIRSSRNSGSDPLDGSSIESWKTRLQTIFRFMLEAKPEYIQIRYIGVADEGRELVRVDRMGPGGTIRIVEGAALQQKGDTSYFQDTLRLAEGNSTLSEIELNREYGQIIVPRSPVIRSSIPVYDPQGRIFGIIVINKDVAQNIAEIVAGSNNTDQYYLTNGSGEYLYHPDDSKTFRFEYGGSDRISSDIPELALAYATKEETAQSQLQELEDVSYVVHLRKFVYDRNNNDRVMGLVIRKTLADALLVSNQVKSRSYLILSFTTLLIIIAGIVIANRIVNPFRLLSHAVYNLKQGKYQQVALDSAGNDEAGLLTRSFNEMVETIRVREENLLFEAAEREKAEKQIRAVLDNAADSIISIDIHGSIISVNRAATGLFGYTDGEMLGQNVKMLMPEPYAREHDGYIDNYLRTGNRKVLNQRRELVAARKDGHVFPIELAVTEISYDKSRTFIGVIRDISIEKNAERQLSSQKEYYESIIRNQSVATLVLDSEHRVVIWNRACEQMTGLTEKEVLGTSAHWRGFYPEQRPILADLVLEEDFDRIDELYTTGLTHSESTGGFLVENWIFPSNRNTPIYVAIEASPIRDEAGNIIAVIETLNDITRLEEARENLERSNEELERFAFLASHDLQEPLRTIDSYSNLLAERYTDKLDDQAGDFIRFITDNVQRMRELINDLLSLSRIDNAGREFTDVDLKDSFSTALNNLDTAIRESGARIKSENLPVVVGDAPQLVQLLQNLIGNALKYSADDRKPEVTVSAVNEISRWVISVKDNGIGIEKQFLGDIFVIFKRLHGRNEYSGTGIGLSLCKKIIERHNGEIWVESEPGAGSTFYFSLPVLSTASVL